MAGYRLWLEWGRQYEKLFYKCRETKGIRFDVVAIADRAFYKNRKIRRALIGTNIKSIGKMAFYGTKQLRHIDIRTKKLKAIGKKAFIGIYPAAKIKIPRTRKKKYIKLLANKYG